MIETPFKLLIADFSSCAILFVDVPTGEILNEIPYPESLRPICAAITEDRKTAYIPAAGSGGSGMLFALSLDTLSFYHLPVNLPHPVQFTLAPGGKRAFLAGPSSALYDLDLTSMELKNWGQMPEDTNCVGIAADKNNIYTVWEYAGGGSVAVFSRQGELCKQIPLAGIPTSVSLTKDGLLIVPYTASPYTGEGLALLSTKDNSDSSPAVIIVQCAYCTKGVKAYPNHVALSPDETTAYVVNEDSSSLTVVDLLQSTVTGCIPIGHSLSQLCISPDGKFAVGASNMFGDLCLIDLVNQRLLSVSNTQRELSGFTVSLQ